MKFIKNQLRVAMVLCLSVLFAFGMNTMAFADSQEPTVSLSLGENIVTNVYSNKQAGSYAEYYYNVNADKNVVPEYTTKELTGDSFSVNYAPAQIADTLTLSVYSNSTKSEKIGEYDVSPIQYVKDALEAENQTHYGQDKLNALVKSVAVYGKAAQNAFGYHNGVIDVDFASDIELSTATVADNKSINNAGDINFVSASFLCNSTAQMRFFFVPNSRMPANAVYAEPIVTIGGANYTGSITKGKTTMSGQTVYYIQIDAVEIMDFNKTIGVNYANSSIEMSVLDYAGLVLNNSNDNAQKTLAKSIIRLSENAHEYFDFGMEQTQITTVGSQNPVAFEKIFDDIDDSVINEVTYEIDGISAKAGTKSASPSSKLASKSVKSINFAGYLGEVTVKLIYNGETMRVVNVNVVNAYNVTSATEIAEHKDDNVVLVDDITTSADVQINSDLYGNSFKVTDTRSNAQATIIVEADSKIENIEIDSKATYPVVVNSGAVSIKDIKVQDERENDKVVAVTSKDVEITVDKETQDKVIYAPTEPTTDVEVPTIKVEDENGNTTKVEDVETSEYVLDITDKFVNKDKYLYRVGNGNNVALTSIFGGEDVSKVTPSVTKVVGNAACTINGTTLKFTGEGVVTLDLKYNDKVVKSINLEVVTANNATSAVSATSANIVLLNDVKATSQLSVNNGKTLYGNGFTIDSSAVTPKTFGYCLYLSNGTLNGVSIVGPALATCCYASSDSNSSDYFHTIHVAGTTTSYIFNSYASNSRAPLRVEGNVFVDGSTFDSGRFCNIDVKGGKLEMNNVTTINQPRANKNGELRISYGVCVEQEGTSAEIIANGYLHQYNWLGKARDDDYAVGDVSSSNDCVAKLFTTSGVFSTKNNNLMTQYNGDSYVNAGILSLNSTATLTGEAVSGYTTNSVSLLSTNGWVSSTTDFSVEDINKYRDVTDIQEIFAHDQYATVPTMTFNTSAIAGYKDGQANISFEQGGSVQFDPNVLTAKKYNQNLSVVVSMNGTDYTNKKITFDKAGTYTINYTVTDTYNYNYNLESVGSRTYTKQLIVNVVEKISTIKDPDFSFKSSDGTTYSVKTVKIDDNSYYIMPDVTATTSSQIGKRTINGTVVYFPIVDGYWNNNSSDYNYHYPLFTGITIVDYTDSNNSSTTYNTSTASKPDKLTWISDSEGWCNGKTTQWGSYTKCSTHGVYRKTAAIANKDTNYTEHTGESNSVQFKFEAGNGKIYYYVIGYHLLHDDAHKETTSSGGGGCVAEGSMITMADGSQKAIEEINQGDMLLTWSHINGCYEAQPAAVVMNHGVSDWNITTLQFSDGTEVRSIYEHGFFDVDKNSYVYITADNVSNFVGDSFVKLDDNGNNVSVKLTGYENTVESVCAYSIATAYNINCITNGILSNTAETFCPGMFSYFEMGENMMYDKEKMQADINKYGLYTYDDFADYLTPEQFEMLNGKYYKVLVGKGVLTFDDVVEFINAYL